MTHQLDQLEFLVFFGVLVEVGLNVDGIVGGAAGGVLVHGFVAQVDIRPFEVVNEFFVVLLLRVQRRVLHAHDSILHVAAVVLEDVGVLLLDLVLVLLALLQGLQVGLVHVLVLLVVAPHH